MDHYSEYTQAEDEMLWEIHQARKGIKSEIERMGIEAFNAEIQARYQELRQNKAPSEHKIA